MMNPQQVIDYWLGESQSDPDSFKERSRLWYGHDPMVDEEIRQRFGDLLNRAEQGDLDHWRETADGSLALVILLDQFSRNLYRRTADAFRNDTRALTFAKYALDQKFEHDLSWIGRAFLYHPFHHAESMVDQDRAVALFEALYEEAPAEWKKHLAGFLEYAKEHRDIVRRFGRFPHRNHILGRKMTPEEEQFLNEDARTYGQ
ncbi:MAG: DUF924 domain-containing protein [Pseudomonadales bacterium]|nr:DUF924 domain-containing protein [Pseudomonadales bacterium]